jgi:hypothetical protein
MFRPILVFAVAFVLAACVAPEPKPDYSKLQAEQPRSILVVPAINRTVEVDAANYFLATIVAPVADQGYYVFPVNMVRSVLADDGLSDANLVHEGDPHRLGELFGADAVLYITIERWDAQYIVLSTTVTVEFDYLLKSTKTGEQLWQSHQIFAYSPQANSGGGLGGLIAQAIVAAIERAAPNYMPLARQANQKAIGRVGYGLPPGPYGAQIPGDSAARH